MTVFKFERIFIINDDIYCSGIGKIQKMSDVLKMVIKEFHILRIT